MASITQYDGSGRIFTTTLYNAEHKPVVVLLFDYGSQSSERIKKTQIADSTQNNLVIYTIEYDTRGKPTNEKLLCFDYEGNLLRRSGQPVLIDPIPLTQPSEEKAQFVNGYLYRAQKRISPCRDCYEKTKMVDCFFVY